MEYKYTCYDESETVELAENIESEHFKNMVILQMPDSGRQQKRERERKKGFVFNFMKHYPSNIYYLTTSSSI